MRPQGSSDYLKSSNPDAGDRFGFDISVSGDTLAVAALDESSSTTVVNGALVDLSGVVMQAYRVRKFSMRQREFDD